MNTHDPERFEPNNVPSQGEAYRMVVSEKTDEAVETVESLLDGAGTKSAGDDMRRANEIAAAFKDALTFAPNDVTMFDDDIRDDWGRPEELRMTVKAKSPKKGREMVIEFSVSSRGFSSFYVRTEDNGVSTESASSSASEVGSAIKRFNR